jgi:hypothetical protein
MSRFRYLSSKTDKTSKELTLEVYRKIIDSEFVRENCMAARKAKLEGNEEQYEIHKGALPLAMWHGYNEKGARAKDRQKPTQYFMIDIDHARLQTAEIKAILFKKIHEEAGVKAHDQALIRKTGIRIIRETPSGGTRIIVLATQNFPSVQEHQQWFIEKYGLSDFGDMDGVVFDFARTDFITMRDWHHYLDESIFTEEPDFRPITRDGSDCKDKVGGEGDSTNLPEITDEMRDFKYNGKLVREIAQEYVDSKGFVMNGMKYYYFAIRLMAKPPPGASWSLSVCPAFTTFLVMV